MNKLLFISEEIHLSSEIPGGVQICTAEYIDLLEKSDYEVIKFPVKQTRNYWTRLKIKLGVELYTRYDFKRISKKIIQQIEKEAIKYIALNQVDFIKLAPYLRNHFKDKVTIIILSHGNESGDFLHEIVRNNKKKGLNKIRDIIRLGFSIYYESKHFINDIDVVLSISETEKQINNWLGAKKSIFIPRVFKPQFLDWKPDLNKVGFIGTLNHKPNLDGLIMLLEEMRNMDIGDLKVEVVGGPKEKGVELEKQYSFVKYLGHLSDDDLKLKAAKWALFINPIFWYSRGASTKLAQGINWGIPIISTEAGNRGYIWEKGSILTVETPKQMAFDIIYYTKKLEYITVLANEVKKIAKTLQPSIKIFKKMDLV